MVRQKKGQANKWKQLGWGAPQLFCVHCTYDLSPGSVLHESVQIHQATTNKAEVDTFVISNILATVKSQSKNPKMFSGYPPKVKSEVKSQK